jgi:hypothetical protein
MAANLPALHTYKSAPPVGPGVQINLDGTITDPDGQTPTATWTTTSGPGTVFFGNTRAEDTTATFTVSGTYVLRLTANDSALSTFAEVTINVAAFGAVAGDGKSIAPVDPFGDWAGGAAFDADTNNDSVANGLAWVLGAADPNTDATGLLPTFSATSDPDFVIYTFRRKDDANGDPNTQIAVEYGTGEGWTEATHDGTDIFITETNNFYSTVPGIDKVVVKLRKSALSSDGNLFVRLKVVPAAP